MSGMSGGKVSGSERGCVGAALGASWRKVHVCTPHVTAAEGALLTLVIL